MADPRAVFSIVGPDLPTDRAEVGKGAFSIGRVAENNLMLPNQKVSRHHADITFDGTRFCIIDLESSNGTYVNETRIAPQTQTPLNLKDAIRIGPFTLTLQSINLGENTPEPTPVEVRSPEPQPPVAPPAPPPSGAPLGDEAAAVVYRSEPSPPAHAAPTVEPQRTAPPPSAEPTKQPEVREIKVPAAKAPAPSDMALSLPPSRLPSTNGHRHALVPYKAEEGIPTEESRYMQYLPGIFYESDFLKRFLLIMESILAPLEWGVDSFEQYYNPNVTTPDWLQWISSWFDVFLHPAIPVERQRAVVRELASLYRARGTRRAMSRLLELYFGVQPEIIELDEPLSTFKVRLPFAKKDNTPQNRALAEQLIMVIKPAHTAFTLET